MATRIQSTALADCGADEVGEALAAPYDPERQVPFGTMFATLVVTAPAQLGVASYEV
jgi:hypothetical protein